MIRTQPVSKARRMLRVVLPAVSALMSIAVSSYSSAQSLVESDIQIVKSESVKISNIDDWFIGAFGPNDSINNLQYRWDEECVYTSTGAYQVTMSSQNGGSRLTLKSSANDTMDYFLYVYYRRGPNYDLQGYSTANTTITNLSGSQDINCADENVTGVNLWFAALVRPLEFNAAPPGIYQDLVTLTVRPE